MKNHKEGRKYFFLSLDIFELKDEKEEKLENRLIKLKVSFKMDVQIKSD